MKLIKTDEAWWVVACNKANPIDCSVAIRRIRPIGVCFRVPSGDRLQPLVNRGRRQTTLLPRVAPNDYTQPRTDDGDA